MAVQPIRVMPGGGGADAIGQILGTGVNVLQKSLDNATTLGRAMADLQFRQEESFLGERERLDKKGERRNLEMRRRFEADRGYDRGVLESDRDFTEGSRRFDAGLGLQYGQLGVQRDRLGMQQDELAFRKERAGIDDTYRNRVLDEVTLPGAESNIAYQKSQADRYTGKVDTTLRLLMGNDRYEAFKSGESAGSHPPLAADPTGGITPSSVIPGSSPQSVLTPSPADVVSGDLLPPRSGSPLGNPYSAPGAAQNQGGNPYQPELWMDTINQMTDNRIMSILNDPDIAPALVDTGLYGQLEEALELRGIEAEAMKMAGKNSPTKSAAGIAVDTGAGGGRSLDTTGGNETQSKGSVLLGR